MTSLLTYKKQHRLLVSVGAFLIFVGLLFALPVDAKVGVGMGAGEIRLNEPVKPGGVYTLPNVRIFNTGDETTTYGMNIAYHQDHFELRPGSEWFTFSPLTFTLDAGKNQEVGVTMVVPLKAAPGDYFAFIESGPVTGEHTGTSVGVAVATKLYFTVVPANMFQAAVYRASSAFDAYTPWSWVGLGVLALFAVTWLFRKFFSFNISIKKN